MRFDVVAEVTVTVDPDEPAPRIEPAPITPATLRWMRYRERQRRFDEARQLPGFNGYSLRPFKDVVIDGRHLHLTPRLMED